MHPVINVQALTLQPAELDNDSKYYTSTKSKLTVKSSLGMYGLSGLRKTLGDSNPNQESSCAFGVCCLGGPA